jgi:hypothetical protein
VYRKRFDRGPRLEAPGPLLEDDDAWRAFSTRIAHWEGSSLLDSAITTTKKGATT